MTRRAMSIVLALLFLDASVTFQNVWPTPAVYWRGEVSIELAVTIFIVALVGVRFGSVGRTTAAWVAALWTLLIIGRYAEVTAPALYGRDVNLYWDLRFIPDVVRMVARVAPVWVITASVAAAIVALAILYLLARTAWRTVAAAMVDSRSRRVLMVASVAAVLAFAEHWRSGPLDESSTFPAPVMLTYARQLRFVADAFFRITPLAASPRMTSDLSRVRGADVFLVFIESYGAVSFERREIVERLAEARSALDAVVHATGREAVSAFVESPTFGGSSWLAHVTLMSGIDVRDPRTNARLMTEQRDTLVRLFSRRGFRTVALMPGLRQRWPEGVFYGFDEIYGADRLAYHGPEFGWFSIPDQYSLERLDILEVERSPRPPLFVFFPTLSTHFPFNPTPPYQPEWPRMLNARPYDVPAIVRAYAREPDWMNFTPGYIDALTYDLTTVMGYLRKHAARDLVMILIGDHQPPALVSGERASWNVPVHVIAGRAPICDRLRARGFRSGLVPEARTLTRMDALLPILLDAFGDSEQR
jgi:hypothetical protein